jgi:hypothetical protein
VAAHLASVGTETLAEIADGEPPPDATRATVELEDGPVAIALRRRPAGQ